MRRRHSCSKFPVIGSGNRDVCGRRLDEVLEVMNELFHVLLPGVPGAHQPTSTLSDESVKFPSVVAQGQNDMGRQFGEDRVGLRRE